jgi:hypothetical protein
VILLEGRPSVNKDPVIFQKSDLACHFQYIISPSAKKNNPGLAGLGIYRPQFESPLGQVHLVPGQPEDFPALLSGKIAKGRDLGCMMRQKRQ